MATVATVDGRGRPRTRVLHPLWEPDPADPDLLIGWIAVFATGLKRTHIATTPYLSLTYWAPSQDTCSADCEVSMLDDTDTDTCTEVWEKFAAAPAPVGYDPAVIPQWSRGPAAAEFAVWRCRPYRLRVMPAAVMTSGQGQVLHWRRR